MKLLLVHHFPLSRITGVTVMVSELLRLVPAADPDTVAAYQDFEAADLAGALAARHADATCVIGINLHIEVGWERSLAVFDWCRRTRKPAWLYVHDYWPHHRAGVETLVRRFGVRLLASTPFLRESLARDGFEATLVMVGVPLPRTGPVAGELGPGPRVVASAGRLVPRKRFDDVVRGFRSADVAGRARLSLRLFPSLVYGPDEDDALYRRIEAEASRCPPGAVELHRDPPGPLEYARFAVYVCASEYEGFSMTVIEAAYHGCPPLVSDIPPHRAIAGALFGERADDFLHAVGDHAALGAHLRDEIATARRRAWLAAHADAVRAAIAARWSLARTAARLVELARLDSGRPAPDASAAAGTIARGPASERDTR